MKKNVNYVGVDEKYIPEDEKYVEESLGGDKNKTVKKVAIGIVIVWVLVIVLFIGAAFVMFSIFNKTGKSMMDDFYRESEAMDEQFKRETTSMEEENKKFAFNSSLKYMQGTRSKFVLSQDLDKIVTSNKTNKNHLIEVTYNGTTSTAEDDIVSIKHSLIDGKSYEVSVDYDANGYINKITIKDI